MAYATPATGDLRRVRALRWTYWLLIAGWAAAAVAVVSLSTIDDESVLFTAPLILIIGIGTIFQARRAGQPIAFWLGVAAIVVVLLGVLMINAQGWGPARAREPLSWLGIVYLLCSAPPTFIGCMGIRAAQRGEAAVDLDWLWEGRAVAMAGVVFGILVMAFAFLGQVSGLERHQIMGPMLTAGGTIIAGGLIAYAIAMGKRD